MTQQEKIDFCEQYGVKYDAGCRTELALEMAEYFGTEYMYRALIEALSDDEALDNLEFINRMAQ